MFLSHSSQYVCDVLVSYHEHFVFETGQISKIVINILASSSLYFLDMVFLSQSSPVLIWPKEGHYKSCISWSQTPVILLIFPKSFKFSRSSSRPLSFLYPVVSRADLFFNVKTTHGGIRIISSHTEQNSQSYMNTSTFFSICCQYKQSMQRLSLQSLCFSMKALLRQVSLTASITS